MAGPIATNSMNAYPTPIGSHVDDLRRKDPAALISCLKQHQPDFLPLYLALLSHNPGLKNDTRACKQFAEALVYASLLLLPELVVALLDFPLTLPAALNPENSNFIFNADPSTTSMRIANKYDVNQFGFEEAIYVAIMEGYAQGKLSDAERIVRSILEQAVRMHRSRNKHSEDDPKVYYLNNSGPSQCNASYLDNSLAEAQRLGLESIIGLLKPYVDNYGISSDEAIRDQLDRLCTHAGNKVQLRNLSTQLSELLEKRRYRFLDRELLDEALSFAIMHHLNGLVAVLLNHPQFKIDDMELDEIVNLFSQAVNSFSFEVVEHLREHVANFEEIFIGYRRNQSENPIVTCLQVYLEARTTPDCQNPGPILGILFEIDRIMDEESEDGEEIQEKINILKEEMADAPCPFDQAVIDLANKYRVLESDQSDTDDCEEVDDDGEEVDSEDCQAANSDDREEIHSGDNDI